jgi:hypothetical protein
VATSDFWLVYIGHIGSEGWGIYAYTRNSDYNLLSATELKILKIYKEQFSTLKASIPTKCYTRNLNFSKLSVKWCNWCNPSCPKPYMVDLSGWHHCLEPQTYQMFFTMAVWQRGFWQNLLLIAHSFMYESLHIHRCVPVWFLHKEQILWIEATHHIQNPYMV